MKNCFRLTILFAMFLCFLPNLNAFVVDVKPAKEKTTVENFSKDKTYKKISKKELRKLNRQNKKAKRWSKFQKKWEMRKAKKRRFFGGATDDIRFKLGLILFAASLLIGILARVPLFGGLFGILAGLTGLGRFGDDVSGFVGLLLVV